MTSTYALDIEEAAEKLEKMGDRTPAPDRSPFPEAMATTNKDVLGKVAAFLDEWLDELVPALDTKRAQWALEEKAYRAQSDGPQEDPFVGACGDNIPLIAMAVDPIVSRFDNAVFEQSPVFSFKALRKSYVEYPEFLTQYVEFFQKHRMRLREVSVPRFIELAKHGTCVFKAVYDCVEYPYTAYDANWNPVQRRRVEYKGPRIVGVPLGNFLFPPHQQTLQDAPICGEELRVTYQQLKKAEQSKKLHDVDRVRGEEKASSRNVLEEELASGANHTDAQLKNTFITDLYELWFDYDLNDDGNTTPMVATYHRPTQTFLQLRYNWYFHQKKPYVVIPYVVTNNSLYGLGIGEMVYPIQEMLTQWHRHGLNNAYLANIRMFIAQRNAKIEQKPKLFTGRVFYVDNPATDLIPFNAAADIYPSTLAERQNLIGIAEKRTGVSDYLTGRESPIVGSRATATSTLALIKEGTERVKSGLRNIRNGYADLLDMCFSIWLQYGVGNVEEEVFGDDEVRTKVVEFFDTMADKDNVNGSLAMELNAMDSAASHAVQQQTKLAIAQTMMVYMEKTSIAAQAAMAAAATSPALAELMGQIMVGAKEMYLDVLKAHEVRNPEDYLPELENFLSVLGQGVPPSPQAGSPNPSGQPNLPVATEPPLRGPQLYG